MLSHRCERRGLCFAFWLPVLQLWIPPEAEAGMLFSRWGHRFPDDTLATYVGFRFLIETMTGLALSSSFSHPERLPSSYLNPVHPNSILQLSWKLPKVFSTLLLFLSPLNICTQASLTFFFFKIEVEFTYHKIHHFKVYNSVGFSTSTCFKTFITSKGNASSISSRPTATSFQYSAPTPTTTNGLSASVDWPFLDIFRSGIVQYVGFRVWLFSLSTVFLRFIHVVSCIRTLFLFVSQ